jgi:hypothetical protein
MTDDNQTIARRLLRERESANGPLNGLATLSQSEAVKGYAQSARKSLATAHGLEHALTGTDSTEDALAAPAAALLAAADAFTTAGASYLAAVGPSPKWLADGSDLHATLAGMGLAKR